MPPLISFSPYLCSVLSFAAKAHGGCMRRGGDTAYIAHPVEAAFIAMSLTDDKEVIAAALLHDTAEDTDTTIEDIEKAFGQRVARLVEGETENKRPGTDPSASWKLRKTETLLFLDTASCEQKILVLSDKLSNISQCAEDHKKLGDAMWKKFHVTDPALHEWYYRSVAERLKEFSGQWAYEEFKEKIDEVFGKKPVQQ
ncbi:MAG: bifunctional (p)ppGpp synthetase/guanosine-3',5'-bis(diphosphate) 3'-pyrophosphohydrolase [Oscillospiraceae bacterium]|nr:bifunctional (p)ppGpp synthetase/guanosine-3',5'-bis(diphosphate) 3'-pyrophosphohydrolase [Oscillospiraceae bacterium]